MKKRLLHLCLMFVAVFTVVILMQPTEVHAEEKYCYICEDMVEFCNYCGDWCMVCYTGCDSCMACEDCLQLCTVCEDVCAVCNVGCDTCWICEDCIKVCQNCDACLECAGDGCGNGCEQLCEDCCSENDARCVICHECVLCVSIKCEECGFCTDCAPECQACGACMECGGDGCENDCGVLCEDCVDGNEGAACAECGQCVFCITLACDDCNLCEDCLADGLACPICEECTNCRSDEVCENCGVCWNCAPVCLSCESACQECSVLCDDCGEYCEDCAILCPDCGVCENCAQLCEECGLCESCAELCDDCGACEDCVELCEICNELCRDCSFEWCEECNACENCVEMCDDCGAICEDCADGWCTECYTCSNCEELCSECGELCRGCAFEWCADCGSCESCAEMCSECGEICETCATAFCPSCDSCGDCEIICDECGECGSCCGCDGEGDDGGDSDEVHTHDTTKVAGFDPTCTEDGQRTYYTCDCGLWFEDAAATRQITSKKNVIIPAGHDYGKMIAGTDPVHTVDRLEPGMQPHYICVDCGNYFTTNKKETDLDSLVIPAPEHTYGEDWAYKGSDGHGKACGCGAVDTIHPHIPGAEATDTTAQLCQECGYVMKPAKNHIHKLSRVPGKAPTCTTKGQKEYYTCDCGKWFEDAEGKTEITLITSIVIPAGHKYGSLIPEKPATHTPEGEIQPGMKEHYVCTDCGTYFDAKKQKKSEDKLSINKVEHRFYDEDHNGQCDDCEKVLEALAAEQEQTNKPTKNETQDDSQIKGKEYSGTPWWLILLLALLATGGGVLGALLLIKKKDDLEKTENGKKENAE